MDKRADLLALARKRQHTRWGGYSGIGDYQGGVYECDFVSPYTKSAGNVDADVMVVLQDWSSDTRLRGPVDRGAVELGHTPHLPTNRKLRSLLATHFGVNLADIYATNLFPFIKTGGLTSRIPSQDLVRAAQEYALPQVRIISPQLVICLGIPTWNAVRRACGRDTSRNLASAINDPFDLDGTRVWCQAHTGALGQNNRNRGGIDRVAEDWRRMAEEFHHHSGNKPSRSIAGSSRV